MENDERRSSWPSILMWLAISTLVVSLISLIASLLLSCVLEQPFGEWVKFQIATERTNNQYLLSATAQVLAALNALVY